MKKSLVEKIKSKYTQESQIKTLELVVSGENVTLFYIESLVDKTLFSASILAPLQKFNKSQKNGKKNNLFNEIKSDVLSLFSIEECKGVSEILKNILSGSVVLVVLEKSMSIPIYTTQKRGI